MRLIPLTLTLLVLGATCVAGAQVRPHPRRIKASSVTVVLSPQALAETQTNLIRAIATMKSALPIYNGDRVKAIHMAVNALNIVDRQISGANAPARQVPKVHDEVPPKQARRRYSAQQIAASQAAMSRGVEALSRAATNYREAIGSVGRKNNGIVRARNLISHAEGEATTAVAIYSD